MAFVLPTPRPDAPARPLGVRLLAALPFLVAATFMASVLFEYVTGEVRLTRQVRSVASWPLYEALALFYASLLPLALIVAGAVRRLGLLPADSAECGLFGSVLLLLPFFLLAWALTPSVPGGGWMLLAFVWFALARLLAYRTHETLLQDGVSRLTQCLRDGALRYGLATAAFILAAFLVVPLEPLFGFEMPSVEHGQYFLMLGIGVIYFGLNALVELLPMERWLARTQAKLSDEASRAREAA